MALEEKQGTLERLTDQGVVLSGTWFGYSKYLEGEPLEEAQLGCPVTVLVHSFKEKFYIRIKSVGAKIPGWKPPAAPAKVFFGGAGRRMSSEEIVLKKAERTQIARSVAIDRAITLVEKGITLEKIGALTHAIEEYLRTGVLPTSFHKTEKQPDAEASPAAKAEESEVPQAPEARSPVAGRAKPARLPSKIVNDLFNQAKRAGLVEGWTDYEKLIRGVLKVEGRSPYTMNATEYATVEEFLKPRLGHAKVA